MSQSPAQVTVLDELDVLPALDHFACNLVPKHHVPARERRASTNHVLIRAADIRGHHLEDDAMVTLALLALRDNRRLK